MANQAAHNLGDGFGGYNDEQWQAEYKRLKAVGCGILRLDKETGMPHFKDTSKTYKSDLNVFNKMEELYFARHPRIAKRL